MFGLQTKRRTDVFSAGATPSSTAPEVVGTARTTSRTDEDNLPESPSTESPVPEPDDRATDAQWTEGKEAEEEKKEEDEDETDEPDVEKMTIEDSLLSTQEHIDPGDDDEWKHTVAPEEGMSWPVRVTIDDSELVDKEEVPDPDDDGEEDNDEDNEEDDDEESGESY